MCIGLQATMLLKKENAAQVLSSKFCETLKNTFSITHFRATTLKQHSWPLKKTKIKSKQTNKKTKTTKQKTKNKNKKNINKKQKQSENQKNKEKKQINKKKQTSQQKPTNKQKQTKLMKNELFYYFNHSKNIHSSNFFSMSSGIFSCSVSLRKGPSYTKRPSYNWLTRA